MAEATDTTFVARETDIAFLKEHLDAARKGQGRAVVLEAPLGGGKRALAGELAQHATGLDDDILVWRVALVDEEDGLRSLLRLYASLLALLHRNPLLRTKVEMVLNAQIPKHPKRIQDWYKAFIDGLKRGPKPGEESFQVGLPRDNPLLGLLEVVGGITEKIPVVLDIQSVHSCHSLAIFSFIEALLEVSDSSKLLVLLSTEPVNDETRLHIPAPWEDILKRRQDDLHVLRIEPWGEDEIKRYLVSRELEADAAAILRITNGLPGYVAELVEHLRSTDRLGDSLEGESLAGLTPCAVDEADLEDDTDEVEEGEKPEGEAPKGRRKAAAEDAPAVQHVAALLGGVFPSNIVADILGLERDSVDDLLDACPGLFQEQEYQKQLGSWLYEFKRPIFRFGVLQAHDTEEDRQRALNVAAFMERFLVPRGYEFVVRTLRTYSEAREEKRAQFLRSVALTSDRPEAWAMAHEVVQSLSDIQWPDVMRRTIFMNLLDRLVQLGNVEPAERIYNEAMKWASEKEDRPMEAWLLFAGSRLDFRRQDLYRARDRGKDALTLYSNLGEPMKVAEVHNHLALVELADGNAAACLDHVKEALEAADVPPVQANAHYVRGLVARRDKKWNDAIELFRKANELAGSVGMGPLALEAGVNLGEALLFSNQAPRAADVLTRCVQISQALRNPMRERAATSLLAQAQSAQKNFEAAKRSAARTRELSEQLGLKQFLVADTYNEGLFTLLMGNATEAVALFRQAKENLNPRETLLAKELYFNLGNALKGIGENKEARKALEACIEPAEQAKDNRKLVAARRGIAELAAAEGQVEEARALLKEALATAEKAELREERKAIRKQLDRLG